MTSHPRAFYDGLLLKGASIALSSDENHHLKRVLRLSKGDPLEIVNGKGFLAKATFDEILILSSVTQIAPLPDKILLQSFLEPHHLELVVEKGTELGITHFFIFPTQKSKCTSLSESKQERLHKIKISALKQCKRLHLPEILFYPSKEALPALPDSLFLADPNGSPFPKTNGPAAIVVGCESGLTKDEINFFLQKKKATPISLSSNILRAETASIVACSLLSLT